MYLRDNELQHKEQLYNILLENSIDKMLLHTHFLTAKEHVLIYCVQCSRHFSFASHRNVVRVYNSRRVVGDTIVQRRVTSEVNQHKCRRVFASCKSTAGVTPKPTMVDTEINHCKFNVVHVFPCNVYDIIAGPSVFAFSSSPEPENPDAP